MIMVSECTDDFTASIFHQNLTKEAHYFCIQPIPGLFFAGCSTSDKLAWSGGLIKIW